MSKENKNFFNQATIFSSMKIIEIIEACKKSNFNGKRISIKKSYFDG